jgi:hypothetical protein
LTTEIAEEAAGQPAAPTAGTTTERKPRPRGRTALIMAGALILGVVGGGGIGYAVQHGRPETPLPPLSVPQPEYPARYSDAPALSAADDDMVRTDGDLTKLLIPAPKGSSPRSNPPINGWEDLSEFSENYTGPSSEFDWMLKSGFRRVAGTTWMEGQASYEVDLIQFNDDSEASAASYVSSQGTYAGSAADGSMPATAVPDTVDGEVYAGGGAIPDSGGPGSYYRGIGLAVHGDIAVVIWVYSPNPVSEQPLMALVQSQLERL